jgi:hypothetical protein
VLAIIISRIALIYATTVDLTAFSFLLWCTVWFSLFGACVSLAIEHADEFINWPRLVAYPYRVVASKSIPTGRHKIASAVDKKTV